MSVTRRRAQRPSAPPTDPGAAAEVRTADPASDEDPTLAFATWELVVVGLVLAVGVALRFISTSALWLDEAQSVTIAALGMAEIPDALARDGLPPLYYWLLSGWIEVFGDGPVAVRSLSGVLSVAALPLAYVAGRRLAGPAVGISALLLLGVSPFAIRYATEARMYSLVVLLVLAGFLLVQSAQRRSRLATFVGIAIITGLLLLTHYWTFWLVGAVGLVLVWRWRRGPTDVRAGSWRSLVSMAAGGLLFVPWVPTFLDQSAHTATPWADASRPTSVAAQVVEGFGGPEVAEAKLLGVLLLALVMLGVFGRAVSLTSIELDLRTRRRMRPLAWVIVLTLLLGTGISLITDSAFALRYAAVVLPLYLLLAAVGVSRFISRPGRDGVLAVVVLLALAVSLHAATGQRTQADQIATAVEEATADGPTPLVLYCPDQLGPAVHRLLPPGYDEVVYPNLEPESFDGVGRVDWYDYAERHAESDPAAVATAVLERAGSDTPIWVVSSGEYRTVEQRCAEMLSGLEQERPGSLVVAENGDDFFEHASLRVYPPPAP